MDSVDSLLIQGYLKNRIRHVLGNALRLLTSPWRQRAINLDEATTIFACSYGCNGWHPLVESLKEYQMTPDIGWKESALFQYHTEFCPKTIGDLVDALQNDCDIPLFVYPWGTFRIGAKWDKEVLTSRFCGPSSFELIESEFDAIVALYEKIRIEGYQPWKHGNGFIGGVFLHAEDGQRRFIVLQGNHRMAVLAALGMEKVAVRTYPGYLAHVKESDIKNWVHVVNGRCDVDVARSIFRMYFDESGDHVRRMLKHSELINTKGGAHP